MLIISIFPSPEVLSKNPVEGSKKPKIKRKIKNNDNNNNN